MAMDLLTAKVVVAATLFVLTFLFCCLPLRFVATVRHTEDRLKKELYQRVLGLLSCFAGGVFLGTCLLDLFPEVEEGFQAVEKNLGIRLSYPVSEFVVVCGFFLVLLTEQIVLYFKEMSSFDDPPLLSEAGLQEGGHSHSHMPVAVPSNGHHHGATNSPQVTGRRRHSSLDVIGERERRRHASIEGISDRPQTPSSLNGDPFHEVPLGAMPDLDGTGLEPHSTSRTLLLLLALSLHSVFEGLAVGLQSDVESLLQICGAVAIHKCVIAFSLSLNLVQSRLKVRSVLQAALLFSLASPLGAVAGTFLDELGASATTQLANAILQGIACGTFLYITFFEVLPHEMNQPRDRLPKVLFVLLGFATVCGVLFLSP